MIVQRQKGKKPDKEGPPYAKRVYRKKFVLKNDSMRKWRRRAAFECCAKQNLRKQRERFLRCLCHQKFIHSNDCKKALPEILTQRVK